MGKDTTSETLRAISHPVRRSMIEALEIQTLSFSDLMLECGLNPNFDTGQFCYHLSDLTENAIVSKKAEKYHLTDFGCRVSKYLKMIDSECSMSLKKVTESEVKEVNRLEELVTRWQTEEESKKREGKMLSFDIQKTKERIPPDKRLKTEKFKEWTERIPVPTVYLVERHGERLGELILDFRKQDVVELIKTDEERIPRVVSTIYEVGALTFKEDREKVIEIMLDRFLAEAKGNGAEVMRVEVPDEDHAYLSALKDLGFEKLGTLHLMQKIIDPR